MTAVLTHDAIVWFGRACLAGSTAGCGFLIVATMLVRRAAPSARSMIGPAPAVTILKPLHGDEPDLPRLLRSFCDQDYAGDVQIVFGCQDPADPAVAVVERLRASRPHMAIDLVVGGQAEGANRKVANLEQIATAARHNIFVMADSDIGVRPDYLARIVESLAQPGTGAVTCLYHGEGSSTVAAMASAMAINAHFLPKVVFGIAIDAARPCFGSTIAMRRDTLDRIGGFRAFADQLADDYAIGCAVREQGLRVAVTSFTVSHACREETIGQFLLHQLRCARTIKCIDRMGYAGSVVTNPFPLALLAVLGRTEFAPFVVVISMVCRLLLCRTVERRFGAPRQRYWLLPIADVALFCVFLASYCGASVTWRGHRYRVADDGTLSQTRRWAKL